LYQKTCCKFRLSRTDNWNNQVVRFRNHDLVKISQASRKAMVPKPFGHILEWIVDSSLGTSAFWLCQEPLWHFYCMRHRLNRLCYNFCLDLYVVESIIFRFKAPAARKGLDFFSPPDRDGQWLTIY
jgi:hypothetical protein